MRCATTRATPALLPPRVSVAAVAEGRAKMSRSRVAHTGLRPEVTGVRASRLSATRGPKVLGTIMDTRAQAARVAARCRFVRSGPFSPQSPGSGVRNCAGRRLNAPRGRAPRGSRPPRRLRPVESTESGPSPGRSRRRPRRTVAPGTGTSSRSRARGTASAHQA